MEPSDLSGYIKGKMETMNLSLQNVADKLCISKQGLHNWIHRRKNINWKLESLLKLSEVLDFKLVISEGKLYIEEDGKMKKETNTILLDKDGNIIEEVSVNNKNHNLKVVKGFEEYSIVEMYVPNTAINDDIEPCLLDEWLLCYNTKEECFNDKFTESAVPVFALMNNKTLEMEEDVIPSLYIDEIETNYLLMYAPIIEKTEDGFDVVAVNKKHGLKIVKAFADGYVSDGDFIVKRLVNHDIDSSILGLVTINIDENNVNDKARWFSDTRYLYEEHNIKLLWQRYFDRNRNEIFAGDVIRYKGYSEYVSEGDWFYKNNNYGKIDDFKEDRNILVLKYSAGLCFKHLDRYHDLNELRLLKWERV